MKNLDFKKLMYEIYGEYEYWSDILDSKLIFWHKTSTVHGKRHTKRVLLYSLMISKYLGLEEIDRQAVAMAAIFHDTRRMNDGYDMEHGHRASRYYREYTFDYENNMRFDERSYYAIRYHVLDDEIGIKNIRDNFQEGENALLIYSILKDSDGLDRMRLGRDWLDESYLRNDISRKMIDFSLECIKKGLLLND